MNSVEKIFWRLFCQKKILPLLLHWFFLQKFQKYFLLQFSIPGNRPSSGGQNSFSVLKSFCLFFFSWWNFFFAPLNVEFFSWVEQNRFRNFYFRSKIIFDFGQNRTKLCRTFFLTIENSTGRRKPRGRSRNRMKNRTGRWKKVEISIFWSKTVRQLKSIYFLIKVIFVFPLLRQLRRIRTHGSKWTPQPHDLILGVPNTNYV